MALAASLGLRANCLSRIDPSSLAETSDLIIDLNLHDLATVETLRRLLGRMPAMGLLVFLINDKRDRVGRVQAEALGATRVLERACAERELLRAQAVPRLDLPGPTTAARLAQTAEGRSIAAAGQELAKLFDGVLSDQPIDMDSLTSSSQQILSGIQDCGARPWLATVRAHHEGTFQHCLLVSGVAASYAQHVGMGQVPAIALLNAAMLHDIGKALVPLSILDKPAGLTPAEIAVIRRHPAAGYDYLTQHQDLPKLVLDAVRHHHEMLDGSGYPDGISGSAIQPLTRILTVCDIFAALTERRPYKRTQTPSEAVAVLADMARQGKLEASIVRNLAQAFDIWVPLQDLAPAEKRPYLRA